MTKREFMEMVIAGTITDEMVEMAHAEIAKMDAYNAKRAEKAKEVKPEDVALDARIREVLTTDYQGATEIAEVVGATTSKVAGRLKKMEDISVIDGTALGMGKRKVYALAQILKGNGRKVRSFLHRKRTYVRGRPTVDMIVKKLTFKKHLTNS